MVLAACGQPGSAPGPSTDAADRSPRRGIILAVGGEPRTLVPSVASSPGGASEHLFELVHQSLVTYDDRARPVPRVAGVLPSLEGGTWRVNPDGTMETVWQLRENARWHDGRPLTAEDVIFSWRVFNDPAVPVTTRRVARLIESIESPNPHTVVMRWRSRYAFADQLTGFDLTLLPSHLLEATFQLRREQIVAHPYWRSRFIGLGPYRVARWISGSSIELAGFDDYFLGRPRVGEMSVRFLPDDNAAMAGVLGGAIDVLLPRRAVHGVVQTVRERWRSGEEGTFSVLPGYSWVFVAPQFAAPQPEDLRDLRVRQALVHVLDRAAIAEAVIGDRSLASDLWIPQSDPRYGVVAEGTLQYPYDAKRAAGLFREAGWRREGADDLLVNHGRRFEIELTTTSDWDRPAAVVAEYWRQAGMAVRETVLSLGAVTDRQIRAAYSGVELAAGVPNLALLDGRLHSTNVPVQENQWVGANRGRYASPELDGLLDRLWVTLDRGGRESVEREIARYVSAELPIAGLFFYPAMVMVRATIGNVRPPKTVAPVGRLSLSWNAHEWEEAIGNRQ